jgi:hypothetical protein
MMTIGSAAQRTVQKVGAGRYNAENPVDGRGLTRSLRGLLGYGSDRPPTLDEARSLARAGVTQLTRALDVPVSALKDLLEALPAGLAPEPDVDDTDPIMRILDIFWDEPDTEDDIPIWEEELTPPPPDDPLAKLLAARPQDGRRAPMAAVATVPKVVRDLLRLIQVKHLRKLMRIAVPGAIRRLAADEARPYQNERYTQQDGYVAEAAIRTEYLRQRPGREVLVGTSVGTSAGGSTVATTPLSGAAEGSALWDTIKTGLLSFLTGGIGAPDILDPYVSPGVGHVYEIKPARRASAGVKQLYARYLFWLNLAEVAYANGTLTALEAAAWAARLCLGRSVPPFSAKGRTLNPPGRVWLPGDWIPPKQLIIGDRVILISVPVPGVICYRLMKKKKEDEPEAKKAVAPAADTEQKAAMIAAMLVASVAAGNLDTPEGLVALAGFWQERFPGAPTGPTTTVEWEATKSAMAVTVVVGVGLALVGLPAIATGLMGAAVAELFVEGGTAALFASLARSGR